MVTNLQVTEKMFEDSYNIARKDVIEFINKYKDEYNINTEKRLCAFIATCFVESVGFHSLVERIKFSPATLALGYPKTIKTRKYASELIKQGPHAVANIIYGDKYGNEGTNTNDGWTFRHRGIIKIVGRKSYVELAEILQLDLVNQPELLEDLETAIRTSMYLWEARGCNELADNVEMFFDGVTVKKINLIKMVKTNDYCDSPSLKELRIANVGNSLNLTDFGFLFERLMKSMIT